MIVIGTEGRIWLEGSNHEQITYRMLSGRNPIGQWRLHTNLTFMKKL